MHETYKDLQVNELFKKLMASIRSDIADSRIYDNLFADGTFELKEIQNDKVTFVASTSYAASIINSNFRSILQKRLCDLLASEVSVEILDRSAFLKRSSFAQKADATFFRNSHLQSQMTFENFVVGPSNRNAYLAALLAVEAPAKSNPIFLYSHSGLGKTHLLHAIGNAYRIKHPEDRILYISSEDFIAEFVRFVKGFKESEELRDFFETIDLFLVDDIQLLKGKEQTQQMFFTVFNLLVSKGKQIVLTSDRAPSELDGLPDRLVSRFVGGLTINIQTPSKDTMVDILKMKIKVSNLSLDYFDPEVLDYLAMNYAKNVRELEGALTNLLFAVTSEKLQGKITIEFCHGVFEQDEIRRQKNRKVSADSIIQYVADYYSLTEAQLKSKVRTSQIALARQIAMFLCRDLLNLPYQEIGRKFGKDHSTVLANCQKVQALLEKDGSTKTVIEKLREQIKNSKKTA